MSAEGEYLVGTGVNQATDAWKDRWRVELHCQDCGCVYYVNREGLNLSLDTSYRTPNTRVLLMAVHETCPQCSILTIVPPLQSEAEG